MNQRIIYCFSLVFLTAACSKKDIHQENESAIVGRWQWEKTQGGIAGHVNDTPQSTGQAVELALTQDKKYTITTNGIVTSEGTYLLSTEKCIHDGSDKFFLDFSAYPDRMVESVAGNKLVLSDEAADGLTSQYKRKDAVID